MKDVQRRFLAYSFPPRSPDPPHLAVPERPGFARAAPALPATTRIRLPSATTTCCDRPQAKVSHLHPNHSASRRRRNKGQSQYSASADSDVFCASGRVVLGDSLLMRWVGWQRYACGIDVHIGILALALLNPVQQLTKVAAATLVNEIIEEHLQQRRFPRPPR